MAGERKQNKKNTARTADDATPQKAVPVAPVTPAIQDAHTSRELALAASRAMLSEQLAKETRTGYGDRSAKLQGQIADIDRQLGDIATSRSKDASAKKKSEAKESAQGTRVAAQTAGVVGGIYAGKKLAMGIDKRFQTTVAAKNKELSRLGDAVAHAGKGKAAVNLTGAAKAADKLKLTGTRAPLGLGLAAGLLAEAAVTRFVLSPMLEDAPHAQAITDAVASGSTLASIAMVGQQSVNRATPQQIPNAIATANIEAARNGQKPLVVPPKTKPNTPPRSPAARPHWPPRPSSRGSTSRV